MKKTNLISLFLAFVIVFSLAGCGQTSVPVPETDPSAEVSEESEPDHYPVTLTDQAGREITIEEEPQRLVSSYYITTSALIALDLDEKLVGVESQPEKRAIYSLSAPEILELPNVGSPKEFDLEGCAALEPDLVILPLKLQNAAETLETLGINVLLVNPESQELLSEMIRLIACASDTEDRAEELLDFIEEQRAFLSSLLADVSKPSVYLAGNSSMFSTAGDAMYQSDMIHLAGGANAASEISDTYWASIDYEQLLAWDPEYIILASDAVYTAEDVLNDPNLASCTAVVNQNVYQLPNNAEPWDSPVPGSILGSLWLANVLHPDLFSDADCTALMDKYYETFYDFTYSEN